MNESSGSAESRHRFGVYDLLAESALAALSVVVAVSVSQLFTDNSFLREVIALAAVAHIVAAAARRFGLSTWLSSVITVLSFAAAAAVLLYAETARFIFPTGSTVEAVSEDLSDGWNVMTSTPAPVEPVPGLVLALAALLGAGALWADTAAFRWRSTVVAIVPATAVFLFAVVVGTPGEGSLAHGLGYSVAVAVLFGAQRLIRRRSDTWIEPRGGRGTLALARAGGAALVLGVVVAGLAGPDLPGAEAEPWIDLSSLEVTEAAPWFDEATPVPEPWTDFAAGPDADTDDDSPPSSGSRVLVSPLVQIRSRLVELSNRQLFTVAADESERHYWRLTSLDSFDGTGWTASADYADAVGRLESTLDSAVTGAPLEYTVSLTGLGNSYLPVAYELRRVIDDGGVTLEYDPDSGSLIKSRRDALNGVDRFAYTLESQVPRIDDPDRLRAADREQLDAEFVEHHTDLPDDVVELVRPEAHRITEQARSDYHSAQLLQDYLRLDGGFRYDLNVDEGQSIDSLEEFLFEVRAGYCQQFATAFAAMARSIGLPTRVAVGFTWGEWDAAAGTSGAFVVRGEHAHAWPEVYFEDSGWVRFEPTPGRGAPGDFAVTGHVANQHGQDSDPVVIELAEEVFDEPASDGSDTDDGTSGSGLTSGQARPAPAPGTDASDAADSGSDDQASTTGRNVAVVVVLTVLALSAAVASIPALRRLRRRQQRDRLAGDPAALVEHWWEQALEALALIGSQRHLTETPLETARRVETTAETVGPLRELAELATHGRYAAATTEAMALRAGIIGSRVVAACHSQASLRSRLTAAFDPSTVLSMRRLG